MKENTNSYWIIALAFILLIANHSKAEEHTTTYTSTQKFVLVTIGSTSGSNELGTKEVEIKCSYTVGDKKPYKLELLSPKKQAENNSSTEGESSNKKKEEVLPKREFEDPIAVDFFVKDISNMINEVESDEAKKLKFERQSLMPVYFWALKAPAAFEKENISGLLSLNSFVKIYPFSSSERITNTNLLNQEFFNELDQLKNKETKLRNELISDYLANIDIQQLQALKLNRINLYIKILTADSLKNIKELKMKSLKNFKTITDIEINNLMVSVNPNIKENGLMSIKKDTLKIAEELYSNTFGFLDDFRIYVNEIENPETLKYDDIKKQLKDVVDELLKFGIIQFNLKNNKSPKDDEVNLVFDSDYYKAKKKLRTELADYLKYIDGKSNFSTISKFNKKNPSIDLNTFESNFYLTLDSLKNANKIVTELLLSKNYKGLNKIKNIQLQFEKGFLENIQVLMEDEVNPSKIFENMYPIGFSSAYNFDRIASTKLYIRNAQTDEEQNQFIRLGDVLPMYKNYYENSRRDYSPEDSTFVDLVPSETPLVTLLKKKTKDLFDTRIYTDFFGLSQGNPNGLVQTEVRRRFNILTNRYQFGSLYNWGALNYLNLWFGITKLEDKERYLVLHNDRVFDNDKLISPSYATNIDYQRYESAVLGGEVNAYLLDLPDAKLTFYFDLGAKYSRVPLQDSLREMVNDTYKATYINDLTPAGLVTYYPKLTAEVKADKRYGFDLSICRNQTTLLSNNLYKAVISYQKSDTENRLREPYSRTSYSFEFNGKYFPNIKSNSNRYFVRFRLTWQKADMNTFYPQFQIGYSYHLTYNK